MVRENADLMKAKLERIQSVDRSTIVPGNKGGTYVPKGSKSHKERAREHRELQHKEAAEKWSLIRDDFTKMWLSGVPVKEMSQKFNVVPSQVRLLRNVFGLPSRVFSNWVIKSATAGDILTTRAALKARREKRAINYSTKV
jgi:hypothetical protein